MKRVLIISDSISRKTGYATVARNIIKYLQPTKKYKFAQLGLSDVPSPVELEIDYYSQIKDHSKCCKKGNVIEYRKAGNPEFQYLTVNPDVPKHNDQHPCIKGLNIGGDHYAYDSVYFVIAHFRPDIVIPINDIWGLYNIGHLRNRKCFKFIPYLAIDSECMFPILQPPEGRPGLPPIEPIKVIAATDKTVVFTNWAQSVINKTCEIVTGGKRLSNMETIPHGVDTSVWHPLPEEDKLFHRKRIFGIEEKDNVFLIGSVARNQPRKRLDALFQTMKIFIDKHEDKNRPIKCYFHCSIEDALGWNLIWLATYYGVQDRCIFDKSLKPGIGPTDKQMNEIVNCFDAHVMLTNSEGFCSFGDTRIVTPNGVKELQNINAGDTVISHTGKERPVTQSLNREYTGRMVGFKYLGSSKTVWFTPNHRLFIANNHLEKEWIPAGFVNKNHYMCLPKHKNIKTDTTLNINDIIKKYNRYDYKTIVDENLIYGYKNEKANKKTKAIPEKIILDEELCEFFGNYIAEGSHSRNHISISINSQKDEIIRKNTENIAKRFDLSYRRDTYERNRENSVINSTILASFFDSFGRKAHEKRIPEEIFNILKNNSSLCKSFLNGALEGDGYCSDINGVVYTTTSEQLAYQIKYLFLTLNIMSKMYCTLRKTNRNSFVVQIQRPSDFQKCKEFIYRCRDIDYKRKRKETTIFLEDDEYFYLPVKKIFSKNYSGKVYNLSVEEDESYITDGFAAHNCLPALETAAAGVPNIITKYSAHADWGKDTHLFCKVDAWEHEPRTGFVKAIADVDNAAHQLKLLYNSKSMRKDYSARGVRLGNKLSWPNVCKKWDTLLDSINTSELKDNRYDEKENKIPTKEEAHNIQFNLKSFGDN